MTELAVLGAPPAFKDILHVGRPNVGDRARLFERFNEVFDRRWLTNNGVMVQELEARLSRYLGVKNVVLMANGTIALELMLAAAGVQGDVIVPSFTFVATAHAVRWLGLRPIFAEIDPATHNVDPRAVESLIGPNTGAILGVHLWGRPCCPETLAEISARHNVPLFFDASHAIGVTYRGRRVGRLGTAEAFSFHATKVFNTLEGGAVTTEDNALAARLRELKNFGFAGLDYVTALGINGKMNELSAAMGLTSLEDLPRFIEINRRNYRAYREELARVPGVDLLSFDETEDNNYHYIVVQVDEDRTGLSRDLLLQVLHAENVRARRYFWPGCHRMEPYLSDSYYATSELPATERVADRVLCLPSGSSIEASDAKRIVDLLAKAIEYRDEVREALPTSLPAGNTTFTLPPR